MLATVVDRLSDALYLLQGIGGIKQPERLPSVPRPGGELEPPGLELVAPPEMSSAAELGAFFGGAVRVAPG